MAKVLGAVGAAMMLLSTLWLFVARAEAMRFQRTADILADPSLGPIQRMMSQEIQQIASAALAAQMWPALFVAGAVFVAAATVGTRK